MGSVIRPIKKAAKQLTKGVGTVVEKAIEDPVKKIGKESFDIIAGTTDEERRLMLGEMPDMTPEITPEVVPDETIITAQSNLPRGRRGTQRTRRAGQAGTLIEGYGVLTRPPGKRSVV